MNLIPMYTYLNNENQMKILSVWESVSLEKLKFLEIKLNEINTNKQIEENKNYYLMFVEDTMDVGDIEVPIYDFKIVTWLDIQEYIKLTTLEQ